MQKLGDITLEGAWARLPGHQSKLSHEDESLWARIAPLLAAGGSFRPPRGREIAAALGMDHNRIRLALKRFARRGEIFEIEADHFYPRAMLAAIAAAASEAAAERKDGLFTAAELRDRLRIGRRTAILLLEFFDRHGVTLRRGDTRRMNPRRPGLFGGEG